MRGQEDDDDEAEEEEEEEVQTNRSRWSQVVKVAKDNGGLPKR